MKRYFLFAIAAFLFAFGSFSQASDLPTLESLKKQVPDLKDTTLVNCLNLIAYNFSIIGFGPSSADFIRRSDSIFRYANLAFEVAKKINYKKGMVDALNQLASSENIKGFGLRLAQKDDSAETVAQKKYLSDAIKLAGEINYDVGLGKAYGGWSGQSKDDTTDYMKKSLDYFYKAGDEKMEGEVCTWIAGGYLVSGYYEKAFDYCKRGLQLNHKVLAQANTKEEKEWRDYLYQQSLTDMASLYKEAGDYQSSLEYLNEGSQFGIARNTGWDMAAEKAEIFRITGEYDSSFYYLRKQLINYPGSNFTKRDIGATFLMTKQYDSALALFNQLLPEFRKIDNANGLVLGPILFYIGSAYAGKNEYATALTYAREGLANALKKERRPDMMNEYELLSNIYHQLGNNDSAYHYLLKYSVLKDSIQNKQFLFRLTTAKKEAQIGLLNKDNQLKEQKLKQQAIVRNSLIAGIILLFLLGIFVYRSLLLKRRNESLQLKNELDRQQLENEKKHAELKQKAIELEMQALRAQMNPHFIFNCLNSINRFIFKNETREASDYLTRFSRLIRMVLLHSQKKLVPLEDELEMLKLYLDMERLRFKNAFDYHITTTNAIENSSVFIPPLLLQPFCENAIWHGLMHKDGPGQLNIELNEDNGILNCIITDDGVGREKAEEFKSKSAEKEKSMGLKITKERLSLLNQGTTGGTFYEIEDVINEHGETAGTRVQLKIKYKESIEELV